MERFASAADLVPVRAVIAERYAGSGAVLVMRDGSFRMVLRTGAVNFDMRSPPEQAGIAYAFGELVDSLDPTFPIEIVAHSRRLDADAYVRQLEPRLADPRTPQAIKVLIAAHRDHFEDQVKTQNLLERRFYVVVPWKSPDGPITRRASDELPFASLVKALARSTERKLARHVPSDHEIATAHQQLDLRADQIAAHLEAAGIRSRRLDEEALRRLLYEIFHPGLAERQAPLGPIADPGIAVPAPVRRAVGSAEDRP